jgi:hypothetical protein
VSNEVIDMGTLFQLFLGNMIVLHTGISVRYLYLRLIQRKKVTYSELKNGISNKANQGLIGMATSLS